MENYIPSTQVVYGSTSEKPAFKNIWKRPGGMFAKLTGWAAIAAILYGLYKALPFLVAAASNLLVLILELIAIVAILYIVTSKDFRRAVQLTWFQVMRKIYGLIVNIDPISILQNGINEMKKKLGVVRENVTNLEKLLIDMKKKLKEYQDTFEKNVAQRGVLEKKLSDPNLSSNDARKLKSVFVLINNEITRGSSVIQAQNSRISTSEKYLKVMKELEIAADFKVKDAENELMYRKDEYSQAKAQQKAMSSITSILRGNLTRSLEEELAMDSVTDTINSSIAEMNRLLDGSNDILMNFELDTAVNSTKADEILMKFERDGFDIFNKSEEKRNTSEIKFIEEKKEPAYIKLESSESNNKKYF